MLRYGIDYVCLSHTGYRRRINQDNFYCNGVYMLEGASISDLPLEGHILPGQSTLFGVFDGLGGEDCGEIAARLAAQTADETVLTGDVMESLRCMLDTANDRICRYVREHGLRASGSTAALVAFTARGVFLCNIGDSKIFRFRDDALVQLSEDHYSVVAFGVKPPLSQCLGMLPDEAVIEPYFDSEAYRDGSVYLLCSDGLTDMVPCTQIASILRKEDIHNAAQSLLSIALNNGGKDNITLLLCRVRGENLVQRFMNFIRREKD